MPHKTIRMFTALAVLLGSIVGCTQEPRRDGTMSTRMEPIRSNRSLNWPTKQSGGLSWSAMAFPTGDSRTSVVGIEKGMPGELRYNESFTYEMIVTNLTNTPVRNVVVSDECSTSFKLRSSEPPATPDANGVLRWSLASLAAGQSTAIRVTGVPTQAGGVKSCTTVSYDSLMCSEVPVIQPKLQLELAGPSDAVICDKLRYRFSVSNPGTGDVQNVIIDAPLPKGLTTTDGKTKVQLAIGTLKSGQTETRFVEVVPQATGLYQYKGTAVGNGGLTALTSEIRTVVRKPALTISHTCSDQQFIGRNATMDIVVVNTGDSPAHNTVVIQTLPENARFIQASNDGRLARNQVRWELGLLAPNTTKRLSVMLSASEGGALRSTATVQADCAESNSASCQVNYKGIPAILLEVVDVEDPIEIGHNETYVITATNQGTAPDTNVRIVCTLENNVEYVSCGGATHGNLRGSQVVFEPLPSLEPKREATWTVVVKARRPGDSRFQAEMQTDQLSRPVVEMEATNLY